MKKYLSLVLAIALVLTTLALPVAANNDISLAAVAGNIAISFNASKTEVNPGDAITVDVVATAPTSDVTVNSGQVDVVFPSESFEYASLPEGVTAATKDSKTVLSWINEETTQTIATTGTSLFTLNLTVKDNAVTSTFDILAGDTLFAYYSNPSADPVDYDVEATAAEIKVVPNTITVKVDGVEIVNEKNYTYKTAAPVVTIEGTHLTKFVVNDADVLAAGTATLKDGANTITVAATGVAEKTYTVTVTKVEDSAITVDLTATETPVKAGDTVTATVAIDGLADGKQIAMASFKISYEAPLTVKEVAKDANQGYTVEANGDNTATVVYGDPASATGVGNGTLVAVEFNVGETTAYGNKNIAIVDEEEAEDAITEDVQFVLANALTGENVKYSFGAQSDKIVVVPANVADWASVDTSAQETWTNQAYTLPVTKNDAATVKYLASSVEATDAEDIYNNEGANNLVGGAMTINADATYYVVAKIGDAPAAYAIVATLVNGTDIFFDNVAPVIETNNLSMTTWASAKDSAYTIPVTAENWKVTDKNYDKATYNDVDIANGIVFAQGTNLNEEITIVAKDLAGNTVDAKVAVKIDSTVPELTLTAGEQNDKKVEITVDAEDAMSDVKSTTAYFNTAADATEGEDVTITENKITADKTGYYYVTTVDNAGNAVTKSVKITIVGSVDAPAITAKTVKGAEYAAGFATESALTGKIDSKSNGTFTYVAFNIPEVEGANVVATLNGEPYTSETEITAANTYVLTVTATSTVDAAVTDTDVYNFEVVADQNGMKSINGDARYNIRDYAKIRNIIGTTEADGLASITSAHAFATYLAGDLTGDLKMTTADYAAIINSLRAGNTPGSYNFAIMNK